MRENVAGCEREMKRNIRHLGMTYMCVCSTHYTVSYEVRDVWANEVSLLETFDLFMGRDLEVPL